MPKLKLLFKLAKLLYNNLKHVSEITETPFRLFAINTYGYMETEETNLEKTIDLLTLSNPQLQIKDWNIYLPSYDENGWMPAFFLPNTVLLNQGMLSVKVDFDKRNNNYFVSEEEKKASLCALKKIKSLKEFFSNELLELLPHSNDSHKNKVLYNDVVYKLKISNELFDIVRTRLEKTGLPEIIDIDGVVNQDNLITNSKEKIKYIDKKCKKIYLRISQYELAYIIVTLKFMRMIGDYIGKEFDANLFNFIQNHFMCISKDHKKFEPINDFKSTISKVTRTSSIRRNVKIHKKHEELLCEAYKVLGLHIEQYNNTQLIDEEKE